MKYYNVIFFITELFSDIGGGDDENGTLRNATNNTSPREPLGSATESSTSYVHEEEEYMPMLSDCGE